MTRDDSLIWGLLLQLSYNMSADRFTPNRPNRVVARPYLRNDYALWCEITERAASAGINMVVIDLCDGVQYRSRPEIATRGAWSIAHLKDDLKRLRDLGIEPIPKLNFSATHDIWLGEYSRMLSTEIYYGVCRDLIAEAIELFDGPRLFHLGMDEETAEHQQHHAYAVMRQHELWWHDFLFFVEQVENGGARPWIWSDFIWHHPEEFLRQMPKSVLQSNWYYGERFDSDLGEPQKTHVGAYRLLDSNGFEQIPTGSNHSNTTNFGRTVKWCTESVAAERLLGFLQTVWRPVTEEFRKEHTEAVDLVQQAKEAYYDEI